MIPLQSILTFDEYNEIFCNFSEVIAFHASLGSKMRKLRTVTGQVNAIGATMLEEVFFFLLFLFLFSKKKKILKTKI